MADVEDADTSRDDISTHEMGVDIEGLVEDAISETTSQLGTDETDGKTSRKKKKTGSRIVRDGEFI